MAAYTFFTNPMSRGQIARWALHEVGAAYDQVLVDWADKPAEFVRANPMGKVPTIIHRTENGERVVTECAAICAYLAEAHPEAGLLRIGAVPLFSGFMYAAVGSYLARVWRIFDMRFVPYPPAIWTQFLGAAIYVNFFAHHWLPDVRLALFAGIVALFWRTRAHFTVWRQERWMPLLLGWLLVALFIWFAENIGTFARAWTYPDQASGWTMVSPAKLGSWYLLMYISFVLVATVGHKDERNRS